MYTFDWLAKQAELRSDKIALIDAATNRRYTYAEFHLRASRFAEFLHDEWKIRPGDRVALLAHNSSDYFEMLYGCAKIGAILVCMNWRLAVPELEFIMRDSTPVALIYDPPFAEAAQALNQNLNLSRVMTLAKNAPEGEWAYEATLAQASGKPVVMPPRSLNDAWHILYTAGTTGRAKGVMQTFGTVFYNALNIGLPIDLTSNDVTLNLLPCFHTGGLNLYTNPTFHVGGTAIVQRTFEPEETFRLLSTEATAFFGVPAVYLFLSQHPEICGDRFLAHAIVGVRRIADPDQSARTLSKARHFHSVWFWHDGNRPDRVSHRQRARRQQDRFGGQAATARRGAHRRSREQGRADR